ncbi:MAG: DUF58 domain-containing protein [Chloroflexota bacterium]|nr:MAG: DUF58 domain-containing protein [Chloroflexota bacterium]
MVQPLRERLATLVERVRPTVLEGWRARARAHADPRHWLSGKAASESLLDEEFLRRLERLSLFAQRSVKTGLIGEHRSVRRANSFEFADYRHYVPGDDFRRIDWNAYGRLDQLFLKLTEAKEDVGVHLLIDASRSMDWGRPRKLHYARQVAAALGYIGLSRFDSIIAAAFSDRVHDYFAPARGKSMALSFFGFLDGIEPDATTDLHAAIRDYLTRTHHGGIAIVISDLLSAEGITEGLDLLTQRGFETTVIHLLDARELQPNVAGDVELYDVETGERIELTVGPESLRSYKRRLEDWFAETEAFCARRAINYLRMDTSLPFEGLAIQYFRQRRLVR